MESFMHRNEISKMYHMQVKVLSQMCLFVNTGALLSKVPYALYIFMYLTIHELYTMYVKMHS